MTHIRNAAHKADQFLYFIAGAIFNDPDLRESCRQFLTFAVIGTANTAIDFGIYYFLTRHTAFFDYRTTWRYAANSISFMVATTFSFFMNRTWTFRRKAWGFRADETLRFYMTTLSGLLVNNAILFVASDSFGVNDLVAKVFSTVFSTTWNFIFKKFWVFAPEKDRIPRAAA